MSHPHIGGPKMQEPPSDPRGVHLQGGYCAAGAGIGPTFTLASGYIFPGRYHITRVANLPAGGAPPGVALRVRQAASIPRDRRDSNTIRAFTIHHHRLSGTFFHRPALTEPLTLPHRLPYKKNTTRLSRRVSSLLPDIPVVAGQRPGTRSSAPGRCGSPPRMEPPPRRAPAGSG